MLTTAEIVRSTYGVWRLAHADPGGMGYLDATLEGVWRSFRVAVLVAPLYALLVALQYATSPADPDAVPVTDDAFRIVAVETITYALSWIAYPLAAYYLAAALDREREFLGYIVAYNWSWVLQVCVLLPLALVTTWDVLPSPVGSTLNIAAELALLAYAWFIARTALKIGGWLAAALVAMDVMLTILILSLRNAMIH